MKYIIPIALALSLLGCATQTATPFETSGVVVPAPLGCEEAKKEGRDVEC